MAAVAIAIAMIIVIGGGVATMLRNRANDVAKSATPVTHAATIIPRAAGHVGLTAYPWAEVRSVRDLNDNHDVELHSKLVTPAQLELTPGRYEITFANPSFDKSITKTIEVGAGGEQRVNVEFADPAKASLPDFGGAQ